MDTRSGFRPVDIKGFDNGLLYYPIGTHVVARDEETGLLVERLETIVIRSDKALCRARYSPAPVGTPLHERVLRFDDGTVLEEEPKGNPYGTWEFDVARSWLEGESKTRPLTEIVNDVLACLKEIVWLPLEEDYAVLALTVPVTYLQVVFEAVPLILVIGPSESGKSRICEVMAQLCANGVVKRHLSAARAACLFDEVAGFVALDDVESLSSKSGTGARIDGLVQTLKAGYKKATARRVRFNARTRRTEMLDLYGVKLLSSSAHRVDASLGSRALRVQTSTVPDGLRSQVADHAELRRLRALRQELHCWAFEHVDAVAKVYRQVYARRTDRHDEISAPLRTMAELVGDPVLTNDLEKALDRQAE